MSIDPTAPQDASLDSSGDTEALRAENRELRRRVAEAESAIATLRAEALERRAEVRSLAEALPTAMSRHALVTGMLRDVRHHPDKKGVVLRAFRKLGRAPRKALRIATGRTAR
jgi:hypothetical protein